MNRNLMKRSMDDLFARLACKMLCFIILHQSYSTGVAVVSKLFQELAKKKSALTRNLFAKYMTRHF